MCKCCLDLYVLKIFKKQFPSKEDTSSPVKGAPPFAPELKLSLSRKILHAAEKL
jgi:hypothetical protein